MRKRRPDHRAPVLRLTLVLGMTVSPGLLACASGAANADSGARVNPGDFDTAERLSSWTPPDGQDCYIASGGEPLPSVEEITDSLALSRAVAQHWGKLAAAPGSALFSIMFDSIGQVERNLILESTLDTDPQLTLFELVSDHLHAPPPDREGGIHLRVDASPTPEFRVGWSARCLPALANQTEISALLQRIGAATNLTGRVVLDLWIDTRGNISKAEVAESSGNAALDDYAVQVGYRMKFMPALHDRIPVGFVVRMPINIIQ